MQIHLHSLYAGFMLYGLAIISRFPVEFGLFILFVSVMIDFGKFIDLFKNQNAPWRYAASSLFQNFIVFLIFITIWYALYGS